LVGLNYLSYCYTQAQFVNNVYKIGKKLSSKGEWEKEMANKLTASVNIESDHIRGSYNMNPLF
jgi:hypothetical protein